MIDPTTGLPRLIFGNDQGIWSVLDNNGTFETQIGASDPLPGNSRNGNLQITQFYYGAAQPSNAAALIAGSLFYGSAQDNGGPVSDRRHHQQRQHHLERARRRRHRRGHRPARQRHALPVLLALLRRRRHRLLPGQRQSAETFGLLQASGGHPTPDPQWPFMGGANFAVNPVNGQDIVISSAVGRIFTTTNEGVNWFDVGDPAVFGSPGTFSVALAYGAPDPAAPEGIGNLGNFIYVGTATGQIYVTQDGGGSGSGNNWLNISTGPGRLGRRVRSSPTRPAAATTPMPSPPTASSIIADSILLGEQPHQHRLRGSTSPATSRPWPTRIFGQSYNPATDPNSTTLQPGGHPVLDRGRLALRHPQSTHRRQWSDGITRCCTCAGNSSAPARACFNRSTAARRGLSSPTRPTARWRRGAICPMSRSPRLAFRWATSTPTRACPPWTARMPRTRAIRPRRRQPIPIRSWPQPTAKASLPSTWRR